MFLASDGSVDKKKALKESYQLEFLEQFMECGKCIRNSAACLGLNYWLPAIELAEDGFLISPFMADALNKRYKKLGKYKNFKNIFYSNYPVQMHRAKSKPDLAKTLKIISTNGVKGFYEGEVAQDR